MACWKISQQIQQYFDDLPLKCPFTSIYSRDVHRCSNIRFSHLFPVTSEYRCAAVFLWTISIELDDFHWFSYWNRPLKGGISQLAWLSWLASCAELRSWCVGNTGANSWRAQSEVGACRPWSTKGMVFRRSENCLAASGCPKVVTIFLFTLVLGAVPSGKQT